LNHFADVGKMVSVRIDAGFRVPSVPFCRKTHHFSQKNAKKRIFDHVFVAFWVKNGCILSCRVYEFSLKSVTKSAIIGAGLTVFSG